MVEYSDYADEARAAGVEPLTMDALRLLLAVLTNNEKQRALH